MGGGQPTGAATRGTLVRSENMRGASLMMLAMMGFTFNDALVRWVLDDVPLFQSIFLRGVFVCSFMTLLAAQQGVLSYRPARIDGIKISLRALLELLATVFFFTALTRMPFANLSATMQALPLTVTIAAAFFLNERVGWRRLLAIIIGFIGVLLIIRPTAEGVNFGGLMGLCCVAVVTVRDIITRTFSAGVPSLFAGLVTAVAITCGAGVMSIWQGWGAFEAWHLMLLGGASLFIMIAYVTSISAMRVGEIAVVTPFRYTGLIWALLLGIFMFREIPTALDILGGALIVGMGLYTFHRERQAAQQRART
jgi:S-adenosylmethionine uptake transporter